MKLGRKQNITGPLTLNIVGMKWAVIEDTIPYSIIVEITNINSSSIWCIKPIHFREIMLTYIRSGIIQSNRS